MMKEKEMKRVPKLRFPEFTDDWEQRKLGEIYTERNERGNDNLEILSVSIHHGVSSGELDSNVLGKNVKRSEDKSLYKHVYEGDLVFNMMRAWQGAIGIVKNEGMISPAYISAIPNKNVYPKFMDYCLRRDEVITQINNLSYGVTDFRKRLYWNGFTKVNIMLPSVQEQDKLTELFHNLDKFITLQQRKIKNLKSLKKGMMQKLFNQEVRFKADDGSEFPEWKEKMLSEVFEISTETNGDRYSKQDVLSVSDEYGVVNQIEFQGRSFAGNDISKYKVVKTGQIIYTRSPLAIKPFGIIKRVGDKTGVVSPLYIVNDVSENNCSMFWYYNFDMPERTNNYLKPLVRMGAKHTMNISNEEWLSGKVFAPCLAEQQKIANCLCTLDDTIEKQKATLAEWEELKKGLLQQMFV